MPGVMLMLPEERHTHASTTIKTLWGCQTNMQLWVPITGTTTHPHLAPNKDPAPTASSLPFPCAISKATLEREWQAAGCLLAHSW